MTRINLTVTDSNYKIAGHYINQAMKTSDGNYRGTIDLDDSDDVEFIEDCLENDSSVIEYTTTK